MELLNKEDLYKKLQKLVENDIQNSDKQKQNVLKKLPQSFWKFMKQRQIDIDQVLVEIPRFIRLKSPQLNINNFQPKNYKNQEILVEEIAKDLCIKLQQILKVEQNCYALAPSCKINRSKLYQEGKLYGMDISSMFAVKCLNLKQNNSLLQLCAAPGNKSMYACDIQSSIKVIGVQINQNRANIMKNLVEKYQFNDKIKIIVQDATKFNSEQLFDRVLVDAQCTHEGSVKHLKKFTKTQVTTKKQIKEKMKLSKQQQKQFQANRNPYMSQYQKRNEWSVQDFQKRFLDPIKLLNLYDLQLSLIKNGFRLLKPGGIMVYSTCSIDKRQNQGIVSVFLKQYGEQAILEDAQQSLDKCQLFFRKGTLKQTIYFAPKLSMCGGMFICKIKKAQKKQSQQKKRENKQQSIENH